MALSLSVCLNSLSSSLGRSLRGLLKRLLVCASPWHTHLRCVDQRIASCY